MPTVASAQTAAGECRRSPSCRDRFRLAKSVPASCRSSSPVTPRRRRTALQRANRNCSTAAVRRHRGRRRLHRHNTSWKTPRIEVELPPDASNRTPERSILKRGGRTMGAQVVAIDTETDIAVLKVEARGLPRFPSVIPTHFDQGSWSSRSAARWAHILGDDGRGQRGRASAQAGGSDDLHPDRRRD